MSLFVFFLVVLGKPLGCELLFMLVIGLVLGMLHFDLVVVVSMLEALGNLVCLMQRIGLVVVELGAAHQRVGFRASLRLFVLRFDQPRRKRNCFVFAEACCFVTHFARKSFFFVMCKHLDAFFGVLFGHGFAGARFSFRFLVGQKPVRQASGEAPRRTGARLCANTRPP